MVVFDGELEGFGDRGDLSFVGLNLVVILIYEPIFASMVAGYRRI